MTVVAALLAFIFGRVNHSRASEHERSESLRQQRLEIFGEFCAAVVQYRRAQLHRWFEGGEAGLANLSATIPLPVHEEVRGSRAEAWAAYYRMPMLTDDGELTGKARAVLELTPSMKHSNLADAVEERGDAVHAAVDDLARSCLPQVASPR